MVGSIPALPPTRGASLNQNANDCTKGGIFDARRRKDHQRRHRQAKGGPATVKISGREEQRRQHRANRPPSVGPAAWIDEGATWTRFKQKAPGRSAGAWSSELARTWRSGVCGPKEANRLHISEFPPVPAFHEVLPAVPCSLCTADTIDAVSTIFCSAVAR
jgi:hypothetical protein